ncbi:ABC-type multidrug transport system, ATPase component [Rubidibacter lacunae KORDI 51-2]|uniref:ABC-type multidrug transport system, ATPase component n=1 Tax=Rubidibacter lacunae KORDI 51-2 TaxID=582515 RepID=U5DE39_9CHRO|nr:ABC-type multidrug transport system, ATPase component [Rubidibacter lacunae KORDI 51-2]
MIEVEHLSKVYGSTPALRDVTFSVEPGEVLGFLGPNGAGKTTTMRILSGYMPATTGTARVAGFDVHDDSMAVRKHIGYLPETPPLHPDMSVEGYLYFVARIKGVPAGDRAAKVTSAIGRCGLADRRYQLIHKLSKGYRQRVGIAQAIVHDPPVIILDEPTVGLDPRQIVEVRNLVRSFAGERTVVISTHILPEVSMTCNRVAIVANGRVVATDKPENLLARLCGKANDYDIELDGDLPAVLPHLQAIPGVAEISVQLLPNGRSRLRASCTPECEPGKDLAAAIVTSGLGLHELRRTRPSLEDAFLQLTTRENLADSEAGGLDGDIDSESAAIAPDAKSAGDPSARGTTEPDTDRGVGSMTMATGDDTARAEDDRAT